jgi:hypothetical protein
MICPSWVEFLYYLMRMGVYCSQGINDDALDLTPTKCVQTTVDSNNIALHKRK